MKTKTRAELHADIALFKADAAAHEQEVADWTDEDVERAARAVAYEAFDTMGDSRDVHWSGCDQGLARRIARAALGTLPPHSKALEDEVAKLRGDFNDCNAERERWKARASEAERRLAEAQWRPIESAPRDGTVFLGCNLNQPSFGAWPMYRRVLHTLANGEFVSKDLGAWVIIKDIEPDYQEGHDVGPDPEISIAGDSLNASVRYGWQPLPQPPAQSETK